MRIALPSQANDLNTMQLALHFHQVFRSQIGISSTILVTELKRKRNPRKSSVDYLACEIGTLWNLRGRVCVYLELWNH